MKALFMKVNDKPLEYKAGNKLWFANHLLVPPVTHIQLECHRSTNRFKNMN